MITPVFHRAGLVAFAGTAAHSPDIGGTPSMGRTELISEGPAVFEERESSCCFGPECRIRVDDDLTLLVDLED